MDKDVAVGPGNDVDVFRGGVAEDGVVVEHLDVDVGHGGGIVRWVGDVHLCFEEDGGRSGLKDAEIAYFWGESGHVAF